MTNLFDRLRWRIAVSLLGLRLRLAQREGMLATEANRAAARDWMAEWAAERAQRRAEREQRRQARKQRDRQRFGEALWGVNPAQRHAQPNEMLLRQHGLPVLRTEQELADWLGLSLPRLRWFTHDKAADRVWHYVQYTLPKRGGGQRLILAPKRQLKTLQRAVNAGLLTKVPTSDAAHGFVVGRSIVTNAEPHAGRAVVLRLDLKDFFPSITYPRVRGWFIHLGYSFAVASALALLCTEREREAFDRDGDERYYIGVGPRGLVQGAPTSPALANQIAWRLDRRLAGLARKHGMAYTRYADDLTFSGDDADRALRLLAAARPIIRAEHFEINPDKTRLFRRSGRQTVTGLVVNDRPHTPRALRRRLRAILHNAHRTGLEAQNRAGHPNFRAHLGGLIAHVHQTDPAAAAKLSAALHALD